MIRRRFPRAVSRAAETVTTQTNRDRYAKYRFVAYAATVRTAIVFLPLGAVSAASAAVTGPAPGMFAVAAVELVLLALAVRYYLDNYVALHAAECTVVIARRGEARKHSLLDGYRLTFRNRTACSSRISCGSVLPMARAASSDHSWLRGASSNPSRYSA